MDRSEILEMGFIELKHPSITNPLIYELGRRRVLSVGCLGSGNETVYLCEKSEVGDHYTDLVCIHNVDYDGPITKCALAGIIEWFKKNNGSKRNG